MNNQEVVAFAMLNAEELGITQANVDEQLNSENPDVMRLLGQDGDWRANGYQF